MFIWKHVANGSSIHAPLTKGHIIFLAAAPEQFLGKFKTFANEFKPPCYKKHVVSATLNLYLELSNEGRNDACNQAYAKYFDASKL